LQLKE